MLSVNVGCKSKVKSQNLKCIQNKIKVEHGLFSIFKYVKRRGRIRSLIPVYLFRVSSRTDRVIASSAKPVTASGGFCGAGAVHRTQSPDLDKSNSLTSRFDD
jgi:hypothetical protein